jgi:hypothetical protein
MTARCPSDLALEAHLLNPARSAHAPHLADCSRCHGRLAEMERQGQEFRQYVYPATLDQVIAPRGFSWRRLLLLGAPVLAAASLALVALRGPSEEYSGVKGAALTLSIFTQGDPRDGKGGPTGTVELEDGATVAAATSLRFRVRTAAPCNLWILSVDDAGQVSRLFPSEGDEGARWSGTQAPPGGVVLDGRPGTERFFALCAAAPTPYASLERPARALAARGAAGLRSAARLPGLPASVAQSSVLLEKKP